MFMRTLASCSLVLLLVQGFAQQAPKLLRRDAVIETIMVPSDDPRFAAFNPAVQQPRVVIRNAGTDPLEGISIRYGTDGYLPRMFAWTGHLGSGASAEVVLPHLIDMRPGTNTFTVVLGSPNGRKDKNKANNTLSTTFTAAPALGSALTFRVWTSADAGGWVTLENTRGPVPLERKWNASRADSVFSETLDLPIGSYVLHLGDSSRTGHASLRVMDEEGRMLTHLAGRGKEGGSYQFRVDAGAAPTAATTPQVYLRPATSSTPATLEYFANEAAQVTIAVFNGDGSSALSSESASVKTMILPFVSLVPGRYSVRVTRDGVEVYKADFAVPAGKG